MGDKKETLKYSFTVEGQTEKWYLEWLQKQINSIPESIYKVSFSSCVEKHPLQQAKRITTKSTPEIIHLCDMESTGKEDIDNFKNVLSEMKKARIQKKIRYLLGYSNLTFELWIILHKKVCNSSFVKKEQYLPHINDIFGESYLTLDQFKEEKNFKHCLSKLLFSDVKEAIARSEKIMSTNKANYMKPQEYNGYKYYLENPSLTIFESIKDILIQCGILKKAK